MGKCAKASAGFMKNTEALLENDKTENTYFTLPALNLTTFFAGILIVFPG
jgi:hypothetical protein